MKALVYYKNGRPEVFQWTDVHGSACGANQVLIKNEYISVEGGDLTAGWGEILMIKDLPPPAEAEECRNTAEILRDLAAQMRFGSTRNELVKSRGESRSAGRQC